MKTTISLDLSHTAVRLLAGSDPAETLGEVRLDDPDLDARIAALRAELDLGPAPEVVVLIPHSEVLFTTLDAAPSDAAEAREAVRAGLDGMTPYALDELAFDWRRHDDGTLAVAAVARETLDEAVAFARAQGFTPVGLSSPAGDHAFAGRPDFGTPEGSPGPAGVVPTSHDDALDDVPPMLQETGADDLPPVPGDAVPDAAAPMAEDAAPSAPTFSTRRSTGAAPRGAAGLGGIAPRIAFSPAPEHDTAPEHDVVPEAPEIHAGGPPGPGPQAPVPTVRRVVDPPAVDPPPRRAAPAGPAGGTGLRAAPLGLGLAAVVLLVAVIWSALAVLGPDAAEMAETPAAPEESDAIGAPAEETAPAPDTAALPEGAPAAPVDPLDRPADAPGDDRYAATGVEDAPPASSAAPPDESEEGLFSGALDPDLRRQDSVAEIANPVAQTPETPPPPALPSDPETGGDAAPMAEEPALPEAPPEVPGTPAAPAETTLSPTIVPDVDVTTGAPPVTPPAAPGRGGAAPPEPEVIDVPVNEGTPDLRPQARPEDRSALPLAPATRSAGIAPAPGDGGAPGTAEAPSAAEPDPAPAPAGQPAPRARPAVLEAPQETPEDAPEDEALLATAAAATAALSRLEATQSPYAVAASVAPRTRPGDLAPPAPAAQPAEPAAAAAVAPRPAAPEPAPPGEIDLARINLIGVYGTPTNRRALVRLSSGRFEKVRVGDRIDGGRITEIGADDLNYVKGGRSIVLQLARS